MWVVFALLGVAFVAASGSESARRPPRSTRRSAIPRDPAWDRRMSAVQAARRRATLARGGPYVGALPPERFHPPSRRVTIERQSLLRRRFAPGGFHVVRLGESFFDVARRFDVSVAALATANSGVDVMRVVAGQQLWIP